MTEPNIAETVYIVGRTDLASIDTFYKTLTVNPPASGRAYKINSFFIANKDQTYAVDVDVLVQRGTDTFKMATTVTIPADAVLVLISKDNPFWLQEGDFIRLRAAANYRADAICSYEIMGDQVVPGTEYTVPGVPRNLTANTGGSQQGYIAWEQPLNDGGLPIRNYIVQYAIDDDQFNWITPDKPENALKEITVTGLSNSTNYIFRVAAYNLVGVGPFTNPSDPVFITSFSKVRNVGGAGYNQRIDIGWLAPLDNGGSAITNYEIRYSSNGGTTWVTGLSTSETIYSVTGLINGIGYIFQVRGVNANGPGPWSDSSAVITTNANRFPPGINKANFNLVADWDSSGDAVAENGNVTTVGTNGGTSYYGTYDQLGNISEWIDLNQTAAGARAFGGHWSTVTIPSSTNISESRAADTGFDVVGFRLCCADTLSAPIVSNSNIFLVVGDAGNASYYSPNELGWIGGVAYAYRIQKYEISNNEYAAFLNAVAATDTYNLFNASMASNARGGITRTGSSGSYTYAVKDNMGNKPVNFVTFYSALRYANWLHNDAPTGAQNTLTTEDGAYTFTGATTITTWRKTGMKYWLPTSHEWAKAAYYDPGKSDKWWTYATRYASAPTAISGASATGDGITA